MEFVLASCVQGHHLLTVDSGTLWPIRCEKCRTVFTGPFSKAYLPIDAL